MAPPPSTAQPPSVGSPRSIALRFGWLRRSPLLLFLALALIFAVDRWLIADDDDPLTIVVSADVEHEAIEEFHTVRGRQPNDKELDALRRVWLDNEMLYREGLALEVDKGDPANREGVISKALSVIDSNVKLPLPDEKELRAWFEGHREKYDEPARYDFEEAVMSGPSDEGSVREFVGALNGGTPGDARAGLRVFKGRPHANLVQSFGAEVTAALAGVEPNRWHALNTRDGWRAMRLNAITPPKPAAFESLRGVVLQDWKDGIAFEHRTAAVRALAKKYKIKHELPADGPHP